MCGRYGVHFTTHFCSIFKKAFKAIIKLIVICKLKLKTSSPLKTGSGGCPLKIVAPKF